MDKDTQDIVKIIIPIATFILGLFFGLIEKYISKRTELKNIRNILTHEVMNNQKLLVVSNVPEDSTDEDKMFAIKYTARISNSLSNRIFDSYLGDLSKLKTKQTSNILSFYSGINELKKLGNEYIELLNIDSRTKLQSKQLTARAASIKILSNSITENGYSLLSTLSVSNNVVKGIRDLEGSVLQKQKEVKPIFDSFS